MNHNSCVLNPGVILNLKMPKASPQITINDPEFNKLTSAEKLNDSEYRQLIYRKYPNEPICGCKSIKSTSNQETSKTFPASCPGGCKHSCCSSVRRIAKLQNNDTRLKRIRGGGITEELTLNQNSTIYRQQSKVNFSNSNLNVSTSKLLSSDLMNKLAKCCCLTPKVEDTNYLNETPDVKDNDVDFFNRILGIDSTNPLIKSESTTPWIKANQSGISVSVRGGIPNSFADLSLINKSKLDDLDNIEISPCGKAPCRAKLKRKKSGSELFRPNTSSKLIRSAVKMKSNKHSKMKKGLKSGEPKGKLKHKKNEDKYIYITAHPEFLCGHKDCSAYVERVPAKMGWMWTKYKSPGKLQPRVGWKPGGIPRKIREMIEEAKESQTRSARRRLKRPAEPLMKKNQNDANLNPPPTLHIQRKNDVYYITLNPIKGKEADDFKIEEPPKPLEFKITKSRDNLSNCSTVSDLDIEFTPPGGMERNKKKPNVTHVETQVKYQDILNTWNPELVNDKSLKQQKKKGKKSSVKK